MKFKDKVLSKIKNQTIKNIIESPTSRARATFILSLIPTLAFAILNAVTGIVYKSIWHSSLAIYYIMLIVQKILLIVFGKFIYKKYADNEERYISEKIKIYLINGVYILLLELGLTAAIVQMATTENPAKTGMVIAIANAAYAFYKILAAIINIKSAIKENDYILQVIRNISFISALVSMLALTSTMISTFGDFNEMHPTFMGVAIGVSILIIGLGVFMIIKGAVKLVQSKMQE